MVADDSKLVEFMQTEQAIFLTLSHLQAFGCLHLFIMSSSQAWIPFSGSSCSKLISEADMTGD